MDRIKKKTQPWVCMMPYRLFQKREHLKQSVKISKNKWHDKCESRKENKVISGQSKIKKEKYR